MGVLGTLLGNLCGALFKAIMSIVGLVAWGKASERAATERAGREAAEAEVARRNQVITEFERIDREAARRREIARTDPSALFPGATPAVPPPDPAKPTRRIRVVVTSTYEGDTDKTAQQIEAEWLASGWGRTWTLRRREVAAREVGR